MNNLCPECQMDPFKKINDIFSYEMPARYSSDLETREQLNIEDQRAQEFLEQYFKKIYPGMIYD